MNWVSIPTISLYQYGVESAYSNNPVNYVFVEYKKSEAHSRTAKEDCTDEEKAQRGFLSAQ